MKAEAKAQKKQSSIPEKKQVPAKIPIREVCGLPQRRMVSWADETLPPPGVSSSSSSAPSAPSSGS